MITSLILNGCATVPAAVQTHYTLTPLAQPPATAQEQSTLRYNMSLRVGSVAAPAWLNSRDIYYQLLYQDKETISVYSQAQWIAAPPLLIGRLLENNLSAAHLWKAVIGPDSNALADLSLQVYLVEFQQNFSSPKNSYGVLRARVTLVDNNNNEVIAQTDFDLQVPSPQGDAAGGVTALNRATNELLTLVNRWLVQVMDQYKAAG